jgi:DNA-directed RNA polymerase alpha subunit
MDWLKKVLEKHGAGADLMKAILDDTKDSNYIPQERFNEVNDQLKELKTQLGERDKQLKDLADKVKDNEALTKQIQDLQEQNKLTAKDYDTKIRNLTLDSAIKMKLKDNNAKYEDLLLSKFDRDRLKIKDDGTIEGLDEQLKSIKDGYKDLFEQALGGRKPNNSGGSDPGYNPWKKENFNLTEQGRIMRENPTLAAQLKAAAK